MFKTQKARFRDAHRTLRSVTTPESVTTALVDQHGYALYLLAHVLTADPDHAERLVVQAINAQGDVPCAFRELAAAVHVAWSAWGELAERAETSAIIGTPASTQTMHDLHALPDDQRAAVALCQYGGHTYRQAAATLGLSAAYTAQLLGQALRALAVSGAGVQPSPSNVVAS